MGLRLRHHCGLRRLRHARHHLHPPGAVLALALGAGLMLVVAANYSYLMRLRHGCDVHAYTKEVFGDDHAFLCAWFLYISHISIVFLNTTALFVVARLLMGNAQLSTPSYVLAGRDGMPRQKAAEAVLRCFRTCWASPARRQAPLCLRQHIYQKNTDSHASIVLFGCPPPPGGRGAWPWPGSRHRPKGPRSSHYLVTSSQSIRSRGARSLKTVP